MIRSIALLELAADTEHDFRRRLGRRLCVQRHYLGISQQEVADRAGVTRNQVSALERAAQRPDAWRLREIARALDTTLGWLLDEPEPAERSTREAPIDR